LAAAVVAHEDNVREAVLDHAVDDGFIDLLEEFRSQSDTPRHFRINTTCRIDRKGQNRSYKCVAQFSRDQWGNCSRHKGVAAKNGVRTPLLCPSVVYQDRRL